ncbi:hypothetical protein TNIN_235531 [Trichonephila inaurata madagascariensis]|uniref:Uncharacterized protein n=1 Tax=Trichonephila inaurata madagascariensis TaxID=2747483 RepID=A0A8X6YJR6_9ARAC|nr:hypothetical protein TNIN_104441 [Trichonephila inaurata madagascariensis]GFY72789.1 hypothetical protein TNIN_235531 [Trichonephila inaurata madagascariensis]
MGYGRFGINVDNGVLWNENLSIQTVIRGSKTIQRWTCWHVNRVSSSPKGVVQRWRASLKGRRAAFKGSTHKWGKEIGPSMTRGNSKEHRLSVKV